MENDVLQDSRLEKYSRLLMKEIEVHEKMERASRLAVRHSNVGPGVITPERTRKLQRTFTDGPSLRDQHLKLIKTQSLQTMAETWDETKMKRAIKRAGIDSAEKGSTMSLPKELERCSLNDKEKKSSERLQKSKQRSAILIQRKRDAEAKRTLRMDRIRSLEKDCEKAQLMIYRIKALSMPSLRLDSPRSEDISDASLDA